MRLQKKSLSKIALLDLLRRKKSSLQKYLAETGIVTYELLVARCESNGLVPPAESEFLKASGRTTVAPCVSSPTEGVVVLEPPAIVKIISEQDGAVSSEMVLEEPEPEPEAEDTFDTKSYKKKKTKMQL
jgi:hypothetical protein